MSVSQKCYSASSGLCFLIKLASGDLMIAFFSIFIVFIIYRYGRPDPFMERPYDVTVKVVMSSVRYLHTMRFLKEILSFLSHFPQLIDAFQRMKAMAEGNLVKTHIYIPPTPLHHHTPHMHTHTHTLSYAHSTHLTTHALTTPHTPQVSHPHMHTHTHITGVSHTYPPPHTHTHTHTSQVYHGPERKARLSFDVDVAGPLLLIPKHAFSPDLMVGDIGHVRVTNAIR